MHSIETLFSSIQKALPAELPYHNYSLSRSGARPDVLWHNGREAAREQSAINHITGDVHYIAPFLNKNTTILTIHDMGPLFRGSRIRRSILKFLWYSLPVRSARYVTVISSTTKEQLLKTVKVNPGKVRVIPNCVSDRFTYYPKAFSQLLPRILHIGTKENKNLERLIPALAGLSCHLHIIGPMNQQQLTLLGRYKVKYSNAADLSNEQVVEEYRQADIVSFVSLYEGFGLPIVEAQATGRPVLTSNLSSMPEVAGDGALLVNPYDINEIRLGIQRLIQEESLRQKLVEEGLENVKRFQPAAIAGQYAALYREVLGGE